jgi:hypothetical protein
MLWLSVYALFNNRWTPPGQMQECTGMEVHLTEERCWLGPREADGMEPNTEEAQTMIVAGANINTGCEQGHCSDWSAREAPHHQLTVQLQLPPA